MGATELKRCERGERYLRMEDCKIFERNQRDVDQRIGFVLRGLSSRYGHLGFQHSLKRSECNRDIGIVSSLD
jgi:hypothetical protein